MKNKSTILNVLCFADRKFLCFFFSILFVIFSAQTPYKSTQKSEVLPQSLQLANRINHEQKIDVKNKRQIDQSSDISASSDDGISPLQKMAGKPEDLSKRDAFSKTFQNTDGSYTAVIGAGPIHYEKNGKWEDIDTKISKSNNGNYAYSNVTNMMESYFGATSGQGVMSKTKEGEVKEFLNTKMYWEVNGQKTGEVLGANVAAHTENDKLFYNNIFGNISAEFTVLTGKRKLNYIIPNKEALGVIPANAEYLVFSEDIVLPDGWSYAINDKNNVEVKNTKDEVSLVYSKPYVLENYIKNQAHQLDRTNPPSFNIIKNETGFTFLVKVKTSWLKANERKFPIAIDPTVYPNNAIYWTGSVDSNGYGNDDILYIGGDGGAEVDGWVRFNLSSIPDNSVISDVTSKLYLYAANGGTNGRAITIGDCITDPLTATFYDEIFNGYTQNISNGSGNLGNAAGFKFNTFTPQGIAYIQNSLQNDFATIIAWPSAGWGNTNYGLFYGYSAGIGNKPELVINYATTCTTPSSSANNYYISNVKFLGTLIPDTTSGNTTYTTGGYRNSNTNMATQIPGGVINVEVVNNNIQNFTKAWVDWNKNGIYDSTEKVYDSGYILTPNTTFGFIVPAGTEPGTYKIRIRNFNTSPYFVACGPLANGETEDYTFTVKADCVAKITSVTAAQQCGAGQVLLTATGVSAASYKWYTTEYGGTAISGANSNTYTTPTLAVGTYTYYVTAVSNGGCESVYRTPVKVVVSPTPDIQFTQGSPDICGNISSLTVTSSGDKEEVTLLNEKFTSSLNTFENTVAGNNNSDAFWQLRNSPYVPTAPPYYALKPALTSGHSGGNYAAIITDVNQTSNIINRLTLKNNLNSTGYLNLKLDFDLYYYSMIDNNTDYGYFRIEYSLNGGNAWTTLTTITTDKGIPSKWSNQSISLPTVCLNKTQLKFRFTLMAYGGTGWVANIAAVDNIRIYGDKPLNTNFAWAGSNVDIFDADCVTPYSGASTTVCIKPNDNQLENQTTFSVNATATLSNGCDATGTITINNNSKTWNTTASSDWASLNWKPDTAIPTDDKCVVIKTTVNIANTTNAVAKNITIKSGGKLEIAGSLTVEEKVVNENTGIGAADQFVLLSSTENSNANYLQNSTTANTLADGVMRAERHVTDMDNVLSGTNAQMDYVYWSAPVAGQDLQAFSPGTPANRIYKYDESTDMFVKATGNFESAKGYAIRAEIDAAHPANTTGYDETYMFRGIPNNGDIPISIQRTNSSGTTGIGYNLVGNPYPSNIDFDELYYGNSSLIYNTAWFWTNNSYEEHQQGSGYGGNNYAVYNGTGGNAPTTPSGQPAYPSGIVKVGQGFIIQKKATGLGNLQFKNSYGAGHPLRLDDDGTFFHKGNAPKNRFWIKLIAPEGLVNTQLIGYIPGATDSYEQDFDAEAMSLSSDLFYSVLDDKKLVIQGKSDNFNIEDKIPVGANIYKDGNYTIALDKAEGMFETEQNIYLKDNLLETVTNLSEQDYTFDATAGITEGRFEIIYQPETTLATDQSLKDDLLVYRNGNTYIVKSAFKNITQIEVYDLAGRLLKKIGANDKVVTIDATSMSNGMYILKINRNGEISDRKILK